MVLTLKAPFTTLFAFVAIVDQDHQAECFVQPDLDLHCPL